MILTKNPNLKKKKNLAGVGGGGGGGGGGERGVFQPPQKNTIGICFLLIFCAHALYKTTSSWLKWFSSFNTYKMTGKGHNSANFLRNSVKSHLNKDPKQYSEFQDIVLHICVRRI